MADDYTDIPYFPDMEKNGWEMFYDSGSDGTWLEFTKPGPHNTQLSIVVPYESDEQLYKCVSDLSENYWGQFPIVDCINAIRRKEDCSVQLKSGGSVRMDFMDLDIDPNILVNRDIITQIAGYTQDIDAGLDILKDELSVSVDKSTIGHETQEKGETSMAEVKNEYQELKEKLDQSLFIQDLANKHGWKINTYVGEDCVAVDMRKEGPIGSEMRAEFPVTSMDPDEFRNLYHAMENFEFGVYDHEKRDKCVISAIRGTVYDDFQYANHYHIYCEDDHNRLFFSVNFGESWDPISNMAVDDIVYEIDKIGEEIDNLNKCVYFEIYDREGMDKITEYLDEKHIDYVLDKDSAEWKNSILVDDDTLGLHFTVEATDEDNSFRLHGGLVFDPDNIQESMESKDRSEFAISSEDIIERLDQVEKPRGVYSMGLMGINFYGLANDGPNELALLGTSRSDAMLCPVVMNGTDENGEPNMGYQYGELFIPANEIMRLPEDTPGYEGIKTGAERTGVDKDDMPDRKQNIRPGSLREKVADHAQNLSKPENLSKSDLDHNKGGRTDPGGRG